jgi:hypothetical protein
MTSIPSLRKTSSKESVNLLSRSWIRNRSEARQCVNDRVACLRSTDSAVAEEVEVSPLVAFSCDIAYPDSPTASRASARSA